ncbi:hypothetical protein AB0L05_40190 [Nonomuraea pusilla]|uniref:hypothetical protein n=1 Tax=Nonomuraea pusilla TaxID=46177 RepID=UPI00332C833F
MNGRSCRSPTRSSAGSAWRTTSRDRSVAGPPWCLIRVMSRTFPRPEPEPLDAGPRPVEQQFRQFGRGAGEDRGAGDDRGVGGELGPVQLVEPRLPGGGAVAEEGDRVGELVIEATGRQTFVTPGMIVSWCGRLRGFRGER